MLPLAPLSAPDPGPARDPHFLLRRLPWAGPSLPPVRSQLARCRVEQLKRREARAFILLHEALGTTGNAVVWFGLRDPRGSLLSVVGFVTGRTPRVAASLLSAAPPVGEHHAMPRAS